jgi:hypothetical protein
LSAAFKRENGRTFLRNSVHIGVDREFFWSIITPSKLCTLPLDPLRNVCIFDRQMTRKWQPSKSGLAREVQTFLSKNAIFWGGMAREVQSFERFSIY